MNEPNFWAIRFIQAQYPGLIKRSPALSRQPSYYVEANGISAKLNQVNWFTFLSPPRIHKFVNFKTDSMSMSIQFWVANIS